MIPLPKCSALQLAVLSARAMGLEEVLDTPESYISVGEYMVIHPDPEGIIEPDGPFVATPEGHWNPAEDPGDALRLVVWAAAHRGVETLLRTRVSSVEAEASASDDLRVANDYSHVLIKDLSNLEEWVAATCRALTEASLSSLGVQGWEEPASPPCEDCGGPLPYGGHVATPLCNACLDREEPRP